MGLVTRDQVFNADDITFEDVEVPEWGGTVRVKALTGTERDAFEASITNVEAAAQRKRRRRKGKRGRKQPAESPMDMRNIRAKLVVRAVIDENGERVFTDDDIEALGKKSARALDRIFTVAQELAGLSDEDMEELEGNFEGGTPASSTSG